MSVDGNIAGFRNEFLRWRQNNERLYRRSDTGRQQWTFHTANQNEANERHNDNDVRTLSTMSTALSNARECSVQFGYER